MQAAAFVHDSRMHGSVCLTLVHTYWAGQSRGKQRLHWLCPLVPRSGVFTWASCGSTDSEERGLPSPARVSCAQQPAVCTFCHLSETRNIRVPGTSCPEGDGRGSWGCIFLGTCSVYHIPPCSAFRATSVEPWVPGRRLPSVLAEPRALPPREPQPDADSGASFCAGS